MQEIEIKVGDTVIRKDGLKGKVIDEGTTHFPPRVRYEDGNTEELNLRHLEFYYLIGHTVLGNKSTEEELEEIISACDRQIDKIKSEKKQLRKQLWRLKEEMVEDWRERKALRELQKANKENKSTTDNQTED